LSYLRLKQNDITLKRIEREAKFITRKVVVSENSNWLEKKWSDFENFVEGVLYDRDLSVSARLFGLFLLPFSVVFSGIVRVRLFLYSNRIILRNKPLDCMVVVVGNLTVGGTGKTPVVERFAKELIKKNRKVAILSRGYKSKQESKTRNLKNFFGLKDTSLPKVVSDGKEVFLNSEDAGDEAYMLARNLPGVVVLTDKNRVKAGRYAVEKFGVDTVILDDGFQYLHIRGQLNLLLVDQTNPFGNRCLLPRGILREPVRHLKRASYVFFTKSEIEPNLEILQTVRTYNHHAEIIRCVHKPRFFMEINGDKKEKLNFLHEFYVGVFCAIASPRGFEDLIERMSGEVRYKKRFLDHHKYTVEELDRIFQQAKNSGADVMITTEKDAVRIPETYKPVLPLSYVRMEIEIVEGFEDFEEAVEDICKLEKDNS
jgi:tetraacyldisaccharide 4'-kinase